jgi:hypothetical protein
MPASILTDYADSSNDWVFQQRVRGSHHIFSKSGIKEIINIQPRGSNAKPYQVKQIRNIFVAYKIEEGKHE